jgi:hypothetical protein
MEPAAPTVAPLDRVEKLVRLAVSARLFGPAGAERARAAARDGAAADPGAPAGRLLLRSGLVTHAQLNALLALERYRDERDRAKPLLSRDVGAGRVSLEIARAALDAQRAEYLRTGKTSPIEACVAEAELSAALAAVEPLEVAPAAEPEAEAPERAPEAEPAPAARSSASGAAGRAKAKPADDIGWSAEEDLDERPARTRRAAAARDRAFEPSEPELPRCEVVAPPAPIAAAAPRRSRSSSGARRRAVAASRAREAWIAGACAFALALPAALWIAFGATSETNAAETATSAADVEVRATAFKIGVDYAGAPETAAAKYDGKVVATSGRIVDVRKGFPDGWFVDLETGAKDVRVRCDLATSMDEQAASLAVGQVIEVRGVCRGMIGGRPTIDGAVIGD